jgi:hypothetical protein
MFYFQYFLFYLSLESYYYCNDLSLSFYFVVVPTWTTRTSSLTSRNYGAVTKHAQVTALSLSSVVSEPVTAGIRDHDVVFSTDFQRPGFSNTGLFHGVFRKVLDHTKSVEFT